VGDANRGCCCEDSGCVSIRSHPGGWEMRTGCRVGTTGASFQSAPTPEGGRCTRGRGAWPGGGRFNPLPPRRVGDAANLSGANLREAVSIRSHPGGWEMRAWAVACGGCRGVSIRSHPGGWEMLSCTRCSRAGSRRFNPLPPRRVGDAGSTDLPQRAGSFNPLPPRRVGDAAPPNVPFPAQRFNPLPPRRVGDAAIRRRLPTPTACFNPLPPRRVGDARWRRRTTSSTWFQSAPTPEGGRCMRRDI